MKRWITAWTLCTVMGGAAAQDSEPAAAAAAAGTVVVTGQRPGPGMWKVSRDGHVLWVLGIYSPLPKQFEWRSRQVEAVIAQSQAYLLPPKAQIGGLGFFKTLALLPYAIGIKKNPDGATLRDVLPPDVYARWLPLRKEYFNDSTSIERERPVFVADELYSRAIKQAGLSEGDVRQQIDEMVKKSKVRQTAVILDLKVDEPAALLKAFKASRMEDAVCLDMAITRLDEDIKAMSARAQAWANGNFAAIAQFDYDGRERACTTAILESPALKDLPAFKDLEGRMRDGWVAMAERMIGENVSTFATLKLDVLMGSGGAIAALQAKGYTVETPE